MEIVQVQTPEHIAAVRALLDEYLAWTLTLEADARDAPTFEAIDAELATLPGVFAPPAGRLLLAMHEGQPAGCVAFKPRDGATCELKRLYVRPAFRGHRIGWELVRSLMAEARASGYGRMVLDSHVSMRGAHSIYRAFGFHVVSTPADFPEHLKPVVVFMECDLTMNVDAVV